MEGKAQVKEEVMLEVGLEDEDASGSEDEEEEELLQNKEEESAQRALVHLSPPPSKSHPEDRVHRRSSGDESKPGETSGKCEKVKFKTGSGKKNGKKESRLFPCDKCSHVSQALANLKKHMMIHTGERPYQCDTCHKAFRQHHHLVDHWRTHTGERPFECDVCGSRFIQKSSLNLHKKRHSGVKTFSCTECSYATYEKMHLVIHMRTHTGEKPYQCEKCGQTFSSSTRLKFHRMIHTGERRYKCDKCGVPFREKATLQAHMAVHLNLGPFECKECGQEFSRLAGLSLHRKVHNNKDNFLYVYNKEANQSIKSLKKSPHKENTIIKEPPQEYEKMRISQNSDTDSNASSTSSANTYELEESTELTPKVQGAPTIPAKHLPGLASCLSPEDNYSASCETVPLKLKETLASNIKYNFEDDASDVPPDLVREALEKGTILETQGDDGKGFIIVLPPSLKHKDIMVLADSPPAMTIPNITDTSMTLEDRGSGFEGGISRGVLPENVLDSHQELYPSVEEEVQKCAVDSVGLEEIYSEVEGEMIHPCEAESVECIFNRDNSMEPLHRYSEAIEEHFHPDGASLQLCKENSLNQMTDVTYIIDAGKREPIVVHTQEEGFVSDLSEATTQTKGNRKRKWRRSRHILGERETRDDQEGNCATVKIRVNSKKSRIKIKRQKTQRVFNCEHCGKEWKNSSNYITHLRTHSGERPYLCDICRMSFKQSSHLKSHLRVHTGERPYVCEMCNAAFTQSSRLNSHRRKVHSNGPIQIKKEKYRPERRIKNFFCQYCNKTYIGECLKVDHMKLHRPLVSYGCKICGEQFKSKILLKSHSRTHSDGRFVCEVCGVVALRIKDLQQHKLVEHGINVPSNEATKVYLNSLSVKIREENGFVVLDPAVKDNHSNMLGIRLKNDRLDEAETSLCEVKQEVIHVSDVDGKIKSEVEVVSLPGEDKEVGVHHMTRMSPEKKRNTNAEQDNSNTLMNSKEEIPSSDDNGNLTTEKANEQKFSVYTDAVGKKVWMCKVCDRSFNQSSNLHCHLHLHTGAKPYQCSVCLRAFRQINHLKDHMRRHTGVRPYKCSECGKCFIQKSAVGRHIRMQHGGNALALREPNCDVGSHIIDTLKLESDPVTEDFVRDVLNNKGPPLQNDNQLSKLPHKSNAPHVCKVCKKQFTQVSGFTAHIERCGKYKSFKKVAPIDKSCECGESFLSIPQLLKHQESCHMYTKEEDNQVEMEATLSRNEKCKSNTTQIDCEENKDTNKKSGQRTVESTKSNTRLSQYKCKECSEVFHSLTSYKTHLQLHDGEMRQVCSVCGEKFKRASALRYHQNMKHGREDRRYKDYCSTQSIKEEDIEEMVKVKIEVDSDESFNPAEEDEENACDDRERTALYKPKLVQNSKVVKRGAMKTSNMTEKQDDEFGQSFVDNAENKRYLCRVCGMSFISWFKLRQHSARWCKGQHRARGNAKHKPHTQDDTPEVNKSYTKGHILNIDKDKRKVNRTERKLKNQGKSLRSTSGNTSNITNRRISSEYLPSGDTNIPTTSAAIEKTSLGSTAELYCKSCDRNFPDTSSFEKHMLFHAPDKPFQCEYCFLRFRRKAHLFNHYRRHAREEREDSV